MLPTPSPKPTGRALNTLKMWMRSATRAEKQRLAELAGTKVSYLYFLSNPHSRYGREASAELAQRLEAASERIRNESKEARARLPKLLRTDLAPVCRGCGFARRCLGDAAIASEFDYIVPPGGGEGAE
jgi:hypothetical protein